VLISSALVVIFGEIIPQSIARYGLEIRSLHGLFVSLYDRIINFAFPIAEITGCYFRAHQGSCIDVLNYRSTCGYPRGRKEHGMLTQDEVVIIKKAVLELRDKNVLILVTP
jgi:CBS domain containing-hemolysin-like protein